MQLTRRNASAVAQASGSQQRKSCEKNAQAESAAARLVLYSLHFWMMTRAVWCFLYRKRWGGIGGDPFGTVLLCICL